MVNKMATVNKGSWRGPTSWVGLCLAVSCVIAPVRCDQQATSLKLQLNATSKLTNSQRNPLTELELSSWFSQIQDHHLSSIKQQHDDDSLSNILLKAFIRTNSMRSYHIDIHTYRPEAKYSGDPAFVDSTNVKHKQRCARDLERYHDTLMSINGVDPVLTRGYLQSLKLADLFGRPPPGVITGNQFWLGNYEGCLDFKLSGDGLTLEPIESHYCLGLSSFPNWNPSDTMNAIKVGLCLPVTCTTSMLNEDPKMFETVESMMKNQFGDHRQPYSKIKLRSVYCLPHKTSSARQLSGSAIGFLIVVGSFVAGTVIATFLDQQSIEMTSKRSQQRTWKVILIESFSITKNLEKLFALKEEEKTDQPKTNEQITKPGSTSAANNHQENTISSCALKPSEPEVGPKNNFNRQIFFNITSGIKSIGLIWIISAHCFLLVPILAENLIDADKITSTYFANFLLSAHLMVDTFFVFSGMLASFLIFKENISEIKTKHWIVLTIHRYWRLTPIYLLCFWFAKSMAIYLGSGPLWDYMTSEQSLRLNCAQESWFIALLHLSDFKGPKDHCHPFAWFIANGMKFWMVTPLFLILISKSRLRGYAATGAAILANISLVGWLASKTTVDLSALINFKPESSNDTLNKMSDIYVRSYSRIGTYLIGLLAGHFFHMLETNQISVRLSKYTSRFIWTLFIALIGGLTFMLRIASAFPMEEAEMRSVFSISSALIRPIWAICSCWFVFALSTGQAPGLTKFLSARFWRIFVKLTFCAYLLQSEVLAEMYLSSSRSTQFNMSELIRACIVVVIVTFGLSVPAVLIFEYPLIGIEELILPKRNKSKTSNEVHEKLGSKTNDQSVQKFQGEKLKCS